MVKNVLDLHDCIYIYETQIFLNLSFKAEGFSYSLIFYLLDDLIAFLNVCHFVVVVGCSIFFSFQNLPQNLYLFPNLSKKSFVLLHVGYILLHAEEQFFRRLIIVSK